MTTVLLTLIAPAASEDQLTGLLFEHEPSARAGFGIRDARYHGQAVIYNNLADQIKGHVRMIEISIVLENDEVGGLLNNIAAELPTLGMSYRTSPTSSPKRIE